MVRYDDRLLFIQNQEVLRHAHNICAHVSLDLNKKDKDVTVSMTHKPEPERVIMRCNLLISLKFFYDFQAS